MQLAALVGDALAALRVGPVAVLPEVGEGWASVGRAVHRAWVEAGGRGPLLALDARHVCAPADVQAAADALGEGLLHLGPGVPVPARARIPMLRHAGPPVALEGVDDRLDALSVVATDPSLVRARAAVLAYARAGEVVYLSGPPGSGRASLARWAAAALGAPLVEIDRDRLGHAAPGAWVLVRDLEELSPEHLEPLRARLAPPPPANGRTELGTRPDHPAARGILGRDRAFCDVLAAAVLHAPTASPVLLLGESGTGKEPLARLLHDASGRRGEIVTLDLASRNANLVEDDLFGHVPGAFQDARAAREGAFRRAHRGTLFLDEIGNLPPALQDRLLRVLDSGQIQPLGGDASQTVDVRLVTATNADLEGLVRARRFRLDLYHRLAGVVLRLPALRDRGDDAVLLAEHFARAKGAPGLAPDAIAAVRKAEWPGNVRELRRRVEAAAGVTKEPIGARELGFAPPAPIFVTGVLDVLEHPGALGRREAQTLAALGVHLASPAERGAGCLENAVLARLGGRPITADALRRLLAWHWWGNFVELDRKLGALRAGPAGPVDGPALDTLFPQPGVGAREPLVSLLCASVRIDGTVHGWRALHHDEALVIGRARASVELDPPRRAWLADRTDAPGFLAFPLLPELSRAHALVTRKGAGLVVTSAPGVSLPVSAGPLDGPLRPVSDGETVDLGPAGELRVQRDGELLLQLFLFVGEEAEKDATPLLCARLGGEVADTQRGVRAPQAWALSGEEIDVLNEIVVAFVRIGGEFAPHLRAALAPSAHPALRGYLLSAHPTQSCVRLYQSPVNEALRLAFARRVWEEGLVRQARERLPTGLKTLVGERPGARVHEV